MTAPARPPEGGQTLAPRWRLALPAVPALALATSAWLPFVNTADLWFGMPAMAVWITLWCLLTTPVLLYAMPALDNSDRVGDGADHDGPCGHDDTATREGAI